MTIASHLEHFAGFPVVNYDAHVGIVPGGRIPRREYQLVEGTSRKFWAIELEGATHTVQFGRIGTAGQTQTKEFKSLEEAQKAYEKLVHEKVKKGYRRVTEAEATPAAKASRKTGPVVGALPVIYRVSLTYEEEDEERKSLTDKLAAFLAEPAAELAQGLVIGTWGGVDSVDQSSAPLIEALVAARDKLANLKHLFLGDIVTEENEVSWIQQSDVSPLFEAYPQLEEFRVRGSERPMGRMQAIGSTWTYLHKYRTVDEELRGFDAVSLKTIRRLRDQYPLDQVTTLALGPLKWLRQPGHNGGR